MQNKIAVVTGASRGIGYATALELARRGAHVIAIARTIGGLEELDDAIQQIGGSATLVPLDITDTAKLQELGPSLATRFDRIDLIIGAAAYLGKLTSVAQGPLEQWTRALATNATANITLLQTLHPLLKKSAQPQAIFLTDDYGAGKPYWGFYRASKAALEELIASYNAEHPEIDATVYQPAPTQTRLREEAFPGLKNAQDAEQTTEQILSFLITKKLKKISA